MKKIPTLFQRNYETDRLVRNEVTPGTEWVLNGQGIATRKFDGTACMVRNMVLYKRYELKPGRPVPPTFEPCQEPDKVTGEVPGWVLVDSDNPSDKYHIRAFQSQQLWEDGTYELVGPKVQGNPEHFPECTLVPHGKEILANVPRTYEGLKQYLASHDVEGIVFWHPDGRMVKIKGKDFGLKRATL